MNTPALALHSAASSGDAERVAALVEGCPVADRLTHINAFNIHGFTSLHAAAFHDHPRIIEVLLEHGASARLPACRPQYTYALHLAALRGNPKSLRLLLNAGANPFLMDWEGLTALDVAAGMGHRAATSLLKQQMDAIKDDPAEPLPRLTAGAFNNDAEDWWWRVRRVEFPPRESPEDLLALVEDHYSDGGSPAPLTLNLKLEQRMHRRLYRVASHSRLAKP